MNVSRLGIYSSIYYHFFFLINELLFSEGKMETLGLLEKNSSD